MAFFGLDIGSYAIKFVAADGSGDSAKIKGIGSVYNPVGQILPEDNHLFEQLAGAIKKGIRDFSLSGQNCHLSLPGPQAYISIVQMPVLSDAELSSAIRWEAEQHIPVSLTDVNFEYDVVWRPPRGSNEETMSVFLVGAPKKTVQRYLELLELVGIEAVGLEPEVVSLTRAFLPEKTDQPMATTLVCNLGALSSSFVVIDRGRIAVAHTAPIGSLALTRALEKGLTLSPTQSEEYKRSYGLDGAKLEGKVRQVLSPVFDAVVAEIRKTMQFFLSKSPGSSNISRVIVTGGGANLPEVTSYLVDVLSVEVVVGNPFARFGAGKKFQLPPDTASYAVATGLSVKDF